MNSKRMRPRNDNATAAQREHLRVWLREWTLDRATREAMPRDMKHAADSAPPAPDRDAVGDGARLRDIVLLHPSDTPSADRPAFVALLERSPDGTWLAAPFSRFSSPATDGEWNTGRCAAPLRVLCPWNARWTPGGAVARGWHSGRLSPREYTAALRVGRAWRTGEPLDARLRTATGAPVTHPHDPRRDYEDEESRWMDEAAADPEGRRVPIPIYAVPDSEWRMAADPVRSVPPAGSRGKPAPGLRYAPDRRKRKRDGS